MCFDIFFFLHNSEVVTESPTALVAPAVSANTSPGLTAHAAFEKKMNEQMSKGEVLFDSGPIINAIESNNVSTESNSLAQPQPTKPNKALVLIDFQAKKKRKTETVCVTLTSLFIKF